MLRIVTDERRRPAPKAARRPKGGRPEGPAGRVACLRVAPLRACAALLVSSLLRAITAIAGHGYRP